jgi:hypothetical protein
MVLLYLLMLTLYLLLVLPLSIIGPRARVAKQGQLKRWV